MVPGDPDDPYREFNAEADAGMADRKMPANGVMPHAIEWAAYCRSKRAEVHETAWTDLDPVTAVKVRAVAQPGESWEIAIERARELYQWPQAMWPRLMLPCPLCQADYPGLSMLWGWIEVSAVSHSIPTMCGKCEVNSRQWRDFDEQ